MNKPMSITITEPQRKALAFLATVSHAAASQIGHALTGGRTQEGRLMRPQGLGRLGGTMAARLERMGLAHRRFKYPRHSITKAGREALRQ